MRWGRRKYLTVGWTLAFACFIFPPQKYLLVFLVFYSSFFLFFFFFALSLSQSFLISLSPAHTRMIMSSSLVSFALNPPLTHKTPVFFSSKPSLAAFSTNSKTLTCRFSSSSAAAADPPDPEEIRWLREEQRWLREEQRWLREEQRWIRERESLLREIAELKLKIQALGKNQSSLISAEETAASVAGLLQGLKEKNLIAAPSQSAKSGAVRVLDEGRNKDQENVKTTTTTTTPKTSETKTLRRGSEGEEVKAMQVC